MSNQLAEALRLMLKQFTKTPSTLMDSQVRAEAHRALAAHEAAKPVAYMAKHTDGSVSFAATFAGIYRDTALAIEPLFAAPVAAASPLSDEQINNIAAKEFPSRWWAALCDFARAIEQAHGIKEMKP